MKMEYKPELTPGQVAAITKDIQNTSYAKIKIVGSVLWRRRLLYGI
jgi:hypothetical protein